MTAILYLNDDWDGGQLRVHLQKSSAIPASSKSCEMNTVFKQSRAILEPRHVSDNEQAEYFDIDPMSGRLVIFRR